MIMLKTASSFNSLQKVHLLENIQLMKLGIVSIHELTTFPVSQSYSVERFQLTMERYLTYFPTSYCVEKLKLKKSQMCYFLIV